MSRLFLPVCAALILSGCSGPAEETAPQEPAPDAPTTSDNSNSPPATDPDEENNAIDAGAILAGLGDGFTDADLANGARQFRRCQSCHTLNDGGRHTVGPNLHGVMGRDAARAERFSYSSSLIEAGLVWDVATLDAWLENPREMVPGNRMSFVGLRDADDRRDVIAHVAIESAR
jgi:cytochrome c